MVLMFQKEVAQRIAAKASTKAYGNISVAAQNFYDVRIQQILKPGAFKPAPKIESAVLEFVRREKPILPFENTEHFLRFHRLVRLCFSHRRKTLENSLSMELGRTEWSPFAEKKALQVILAKAKIDGQRRAETLSIEEFGNLFKELTSA
jgi:16S rRNA (adenine1518-N6/adenine1519-N6)-dimethyltransferase